MKRYPKALYTLLRTISWVVAFASTGMLYAQQTDGFRLDGRVLDARRRQPIEAAVVTVSERNSWGVSDSKGRFVITALPQGTYRIHCHALGYADTTFMIPVEADMAEITIVLHERSLSLSEVTVTAREQSFGSSSVVSGEAITHIQPKSLHDIFQLLPGQLTQNPNLRAPMQATIRDLSTNPHTALGTLLVVNDIPMTNDNNLQSFSPSKSHSGTMMVNTAGAGSDLRELSAENIESVEVIRGIPSAEYGNLTSGVVVVKTKVGATPWQLNVKSDMQTKIISLQKGFRLRGEAGDLHIGADYTTAYDDVRRKANGYRRITAHADYARTFFRTSMPLTLKVSVAPYRTLDETKTDPQLTRNETLRSRKQGFRAGLSGKWLLQKRWITNLDYSLSGSYAHSYDYAKRQLVLQTGSVPNPISRQPGEFATGYLPGVYFTEYTIDGKPWSFTAKLKGGVYKSTASVSHRLTSGFDWSASGNGGYGVQYDLSRPPMTQLGSSTRPRPFHSYPVLHNLAFFIEDRASIPLGTTELTVQAGARLSFMAPANRMAVEPRLLASYELLNRKNNRVVDQLTLTAGWGVARKMPPLLYYTADPVYFDDVALNYLDRDYELAVVNTSIVLQPVNPSLRLMTNRKKEVGLAMTKRGVTARLTYFHEQTDHTYAYVRTPYVKPYRKYQVFGSGKRPVFENGQVYYIENGEKLPAPTVGDTVFHFYNTPQNDEKNLRQGIEYVVETGRIASLQTAFVIDGAWLYEKRTDTRPSYYRPTQSYMGTAFPYIAVMPAGQSTVRKRFNTNIRTVTHIPAIRMIVSLTTQIVWTDRTRYRWDDTDGRPLVYYYRNGQRIDGSLSAYDRMDAPRYVDPIGFIDKQGVEHVWDKAYSTQPGYEMMVDRTNTSYYYVEDDYPPTVQFNLRLTKEFSDHIAASFTVNNFLNIRPQVRSNRTGLMVERATSTPLYFGAELNLKL